MKHWNLRILRERHESGEEEFSVVEAHYDANGRPSGWTYHKAQAPTLEDLAFYIKDMKAALKRPVLEREDFNNEHDGKEQG